MNDEEENMGAHSRSVYPPFSFHHISFLRFNKCDRNSSGEIQRHL